MSCHVRNLSVMKYEQFHLGLLKLKTSIIKGVGNWQEAQQIEATNLVNIKKNDILINNVK